VKKVKKAHKMAQVVGKKAVEEAAGMLAKVLKEKVLKELKMLLRVRSLKLLICLRNLKELQMLLRHQLKVTIMTLL